uniref:C1q domain-containing protein n=1 Tax=Amphiprion percula TaxID=161767 RepID=A0A3P8RNW7_AMPPE
MMHRNCLTAAFFSFVHASDQTSKLLNLQRKLNTTESHQDEVNTEVLIRLTVGEKQLEDLKTENTVHEAELMAVNLRLNLTEHQVDELKNQNTVHSDSVKQLQVRLNSAEHQIHQLQTETTDQTSKLLNLQRKLNTTESHQDEVNTDVLNRLRVGEKQLEDLKTENTDVLIRLRVGEKQLEDLKTENTGREAELTAVVLRLNVTEQQVDQLRTQNSVRAAELVSVSDRLTAAERNTEELQVRLRADEAEANEDDLKVAFSAGLTDSGSVGPFDEERTLIFSKTMTNIGQAYNQTAGVFMAPVRGVYFFSFTAADYLKGYMGLYLYWNDQPIMFNWS